MRLLRWLPVACLLLGAVAWEGGRTVEPARGDDPPAVKPDAAKPDAPADKRVYRVFMLSQSGNYEHESVKRKQGNLSTAERTVTELGISSGLFHVDCESRRRQGFSPRKS